MAKVKTAKKDMDMIVSAIKSELKSNLMSIILFGSSTKSIKKANDYDILIITKRNVKKDWELAGKIKHFLIHKVDKPIDIIFNDMSDLEFSSPLLYEASHQGKILYGENIISKIKKLTSNIKPILERGMKIGWQYA